MWLKNQSQIHEIFTLDEIAQFEAAGQWPPPPGVILTERVAPDEESVRDFARLVVGWLPPERAAVVSQIFGLD